MHDAPLPRKEYKETLPGTSPKTRKPFVNGRKASIVATRNLAETGKKPPVSPLIYHGSPILLLNLASSKKIPPPPKDLVLRSDKPETWRKISASREPKPHSYTSPPYTKQRDSLTVREQYKRGPFLQRELKEWMVKPSTVAASASQEAKRDKDHQNSRTNLSHQDHQLSTKRHQTKEEIIQDLNEATRLYFSCPDPTEAASRRQRVMIGNAKGRLKKL
ncbi:hypothetical protein YC2023_118705 [Brassica napus]